MIPYLGLFRGLLPPPFDWMIEYYLYLLIAIISLVIIRKVTKMGFIRALIVWNDGTQTINDYRVKEGKLMVKNPLIKREENKWTPKVQPSNILPAKKTIGNKLKFWGFKQKDIILAVEGSPECIIVKGFETIGIKKKGEAISKGLSSVLLQTWTLKEIADFIKKALAKGTVQRRLFNDAQFYMFVGLLFFNLLLLVMIANRVGVF